MIAQRYARIESEIRSLRAQTVIEVGTWNGDRAIAMASATSWPFFYFGFDLFEEMTPKVAQKEYNVKRVCSEDEVLQKLGEWKSKENRQDVQFSLCKGNTKETLPAFLEGVGSGVADMAWIDGGHSVETIESDFRICRGLVKKGGTILLDDYYEGVPVEMIQRVGCNRLVQALIETRWLVTLLADSDPVRNFEGQQIGTVSIVKVTA